MGPGDELDGRCEAPVRRAAARPGRPALRPPSYASRLVSVMTLVLGGLAVLSAQTMPPPEPPPSQPSQPTFRTGVSIVRVDVTVTGRDGIPVSDLTAEDFEVTEDAVVQKIESFQFVSLDGQPVPGDDLSLEIRSREHGRAEAARDDVRVFALFLDDYHISREPAVTIRLREGLTDFIRNQLAPTDVIAVMDPLTPLSALQFTRDRDEVLERVRKFEGRRGIYTPARSVLEEAQLTSRDVLRLRAEVTLSALNALVTHLGSLRERRSSVLFASEGPPLWFRDGYLEPEFQEILEAANRGNVTISCLDPRGLTQVSASDVLWRLSESTGGRAIVNTNSLSRGLAQVVRDASAYYLLGYAPSRSTDDGKFHEIEVKVRRKGTRVLARKGYWAPDAAEMAAAPVAAPEAGLVEALRAVVDSDRRVRAASWIGIEPTGGPAARLRFVWQPTQPKTGEPSAAVARVTLRDARDQVLADRRVPEEGTLGAAGAGAGPAQATFDVPIGTLTLSLVFEAADGEVLDSGKQTVEVPDFTKDVRLGSPRLLLARSPLEYRALSRDPAAAVPTPLREFRRTDRLLVLAPIHAGQDADLQPAVALLNGAGEPLVTLQASLVDAAYVRLEVPLASLAAGDYVLRLALGPPGETPAALVAFRVVP